MEKKKKKEKEGKRSTRDIDGIRREERVDFARVARVIRNIRRIISFYELSFGVLFTASYYYSSSILRPDIFGRILINTVLYGRCRLICVRNLSDRLCSYCTPY